MRFFCTFSNYLLSFQSIVFYWYCKNLFKGCGGCKGHPEIIFLSSVPLQKLNIILRGRREKTSDVVWPRCSRAASQQFFECWGVSQALLLKTVLSNIASLKYKIWSMSL
jgi:hypothetical protein